MATMQDLQTEVSQQSTVEDSVVTMLQGLQQQLKDANASNDPAAMDKVIADLRANTKKLSDAVATNTVASPDTATQSQTATPQTAR